MTHCPRIALLCATRRGLLVLQKLAALAPNARLTVFSFPEEPWEPPFLSDIRSEAERLGATFYQGRQVGAERFRPVWDTPLDLLLAVSWRYLIPEHVRARPRRGAFVFHDALLPAYRGFSPTPWAILNGEAATGVTLFEMASDVDSGPIVAQKVVPIGDRDTIADVMAAVTSAYLALLEQFLEPLLAGTAERKAQDETAATYTCKRLPDDNEIDWTAPTAHIFNLIRAATHPYPGAFTWLDGRCVRVWSAHLLPDYPRYVGRVPGRVIEVQPGLGVVVLTGDGALRLDGVQMDGWQEARADEVLNRLSFTLGRRSQAVELIGSTP